MVGTALAHAAKMFDARAEHRPEVVVAAMEKAGRRLETPCGRGMMAWRVFGQGAPLALMHGGHGSWLHWIAVIPALARHRTLYVPDLPGFGESAALDGAPRGGTPAARAVARPVLAGLQALAGGERIALAGFSFGSVIAATVAGTLEEKAEALIAIGAPGLGLPAVERPPTRSVRDQATPEALAAAHRVNLGAMMIHDPARIDDLAVHMQALNVPRARTASRTVSRSPAMQDALARVMCPLTAIYGEQDVVSPQHDERLAVLNAIHPGSRQHVIPGVGHWAMYEAPHETVRHMRAALGSPL